MNEDNSRETNAVWVAPSKPPDSFRKIHPDLKSLSGGVFGYAIFLMFALAIGVGFSVIVLYVNPIFGVIGIVVSLLVCVGIIGAAYYNPRYCYYATWIFETVTPTKERFKMKLVARTRYGLVFATTIENSKKEEEPVELRAVSAGYPKSLYNDTYQDALVYRDPADGRAIVVTVGKTNIWLSESVTALLKDEQVSTTRLSKSS